MPPIQEDEEGKGKREINFDSLQAAAIIDSTKVAELTVEMHYLRKDIEALTKDFVLLKEGGTLGFSKFQSKIVGGLWVVGGLSGLLMAAVFWLFSQVQAAKELNAVQEQRLKEFEHDLISHEEKDIQRFMLREQAK